MTSAYSPKEIKVLGLLCKGLQTKIIAYQLGIADATVKVHLKNLYRKAGVSNRTQLVIRTLNEQHKRLVG